ncbi:PREDICTED: disintegrin and metalloproteinase domain-containing protein 9-like [Gavialis gangeticus]|uniref:disintegrin and metalloproteinase domain-containing protein 9-like n=1 Tax=Gavialis gangeticus TaxID=94835 RepID=UPI00092F62C8|nr:PREDICTED: disintegrin and metalloproteinase domain-containing protein 9-like [Gavialis gangeticus]
MLKWCLLVFIFGLTPLGNCVLTADVLSHQMSTVSAFEIIIPQRLVEGREKRNTHFPEEHSDDNLSYSVQTENGTYILQLKKNKKLVSEDFVLNTYSKNGQLEATHSKIKTHCYYRGGVEGAAESMLALSTCDGLRGILYVGDRWYGIEPLDGSATFEHMFYQLEHAQQTSFLCGVPNDNLHHEIRVKNFLLHSEGSHANFSSEKLLRKKRSALPQKNYVELFVVVDNNRYLQKLSNATAVQKEVIELINYIDGMYSALNIQVVLVGIEIWSDKNRIAVMEGSAGDVLQRFVSWREKDLLKRSRNDASHLIIGRDSFSGILGMAFVGAICSQVHGGSISTLNHDKVLGHAMVVAHELGHNLGMKHDDGRCPKSFIMFSVANGSQNFSTCSAKDFENLILNGGGNCLKNPPKPSDIYTEPNCGNEILDKNEECDCGKPEECTNPCCDAATCTLKSGSQCADGLCCENCRFKVAGVECRPKMDFCDLPEHCNGTYSYCPDDVYIMNGYPCNNMKEYCYYGVCQDFDSQCKSLYGKGARKAPDDCFKIANIKGDRFGNCGMSGGQYKKCPDEHSLCGKLHCTSDSLQNLPAWTLFNNLTGVVCLTTDFDLGSDFPDPAQVHAGTACGEGKACINFECVNASQLGYSCDVKQKCSDHGVCNNRGNCHCNYGWAPPFCDKSGYGGSIDSGPTHIDTSLRDGLLVFFLLVVPVLIGIVIAFIKRDAIKRKFCRKSRRQPRTNNTQQARQSNGPNQNATRNDWPATSNSAMFTISHFPNPRQQIPSQFPAVPPRPPRPPVPPRPVV